MDIASGSAGKKAENTRNVSRSVRESGDIVYSGAIS